VTPYDQPLPVHGGYLVTYPERLGGGVRPNVPAVWPVAAFSLLFGVFAAFSAHRRAERARAAGGRTRPYWVAFGSVNLVLLAVYLVAVTVAVVVPVYLAAREEVVVKVLQENLVGDGQLRARAKITATRAQCTAEADRGDDGIRPYLCVLSLADGRTGKLHVTADSDGSWALAPTP
jgi:hypothetical protein